MAYNYELFLIGKLNIIKNQLSLNDESFNLINIQVATEQAFFKEKSLTPNTIYVVIKYLQSSIEFNTKTQPVQILAMCEQNNIDHARTILDKFANENNFTNETSGTTFVKHQYTNPVVISNFNEVSYGYRSVIYISGTLYIMENVSDIKELKITVDSTQISVDPLNFTFSYGMTPNTQQISGNYIATSVKSVATASFGMSIPFTTNAFTSKVFSIMDGNVSGNYEFAISFKLGSSNTLYTYSVKLTSANLTTSPNSVPVLQLGFMR